MRQVGLNYAVFCVRVTYAAGVQSSRSHFIEVSPLILLLNLWSKMLLQFVAMISIVDLVKLIKQGGH